MTMLSFALVTTLNSPATALTLNPVLSSTGASLLGEQPATQVPDNLLEQFSQSDRPTQGAVSLKLPARGTLNFRLFSTRTPVATSHKLALTGDSEAVRLGQLTTTGLGNRSSRDGSLYRLGFSSDRVIMSGRVMDIGSRFELRGTDAQDMTSDDAELLRQSVGSSGLNLNGAWKLGAGIALTSSYDSLHRDNPGHEQNGLTTTAVSHVLQLAAGSQGTIKASLIQHREEWDLWTGRDTNQRREQKLEYDTTLGPQGFGGLRLAMNTVQKQESGSAQTESTHEAHLNLAPTSRLKLNADYMAKDQAGGSRRLTHAVSATFALTSGMNLSAGFNQLQQEDQQQHDMTIALAGKLAGGQLTAEQKTHLGPEGEVMARKGLFEGVIGSASANTNVKLNFQESQGEGPEAQLSRKAFLHLDRSLSNTVKVLVEQQDTIKGTNAEAVTTAETKYELVASVAPGTSITTGIMTGASAGVDQHQHRVTLAHESSRLQFRAEGGTWQTGDTGRSQFTYVVELPTGELADWAKNITTAHEFEDASEYMRGASSNWKRAEMNFLGYRLWMTCRSGQENGTDSLVFAHRRMLSPRLHLQCLYEERPEGLEGPSKGRPLPLYRQAVDIGGPLLGHMNLRLGCALQSSADGSAGHLVRIRMGMWGRLAGGQQLETEVWREAGEWEATASDRTGVTILYHQQVSDEHRVEVKFGYGWGDGVGEEGRDGRATLAYVKPI